MASEKRSACEDVGFRMLKTESGFYNTKQPAPELPKCRQTKLSLAGTSPLMCERRINSNNDALFEGLKQTAHKDNYFFAVCNENRFLQLK